MTADRLELRGVRVHNLKGVDVAFPLGKLTVVTGVSGSGKSSLVFDTLYAESQRRYLQSFSTSSRQLLERFEQPDADWIGDLPPAIAVRAGDPWPRSAVTVGDAAELSDLVDELFAAEGVAVCPQCGGETRPSSTDDVVNDVQSLPEGTRLELGFPDRAGDGESIDQWIARLREDGWVRIRVAETVHRLGDVATIPLAPADEAIVLIDRVEVGKTAEERLRESVESGFRRGDGRLVAGDRRFDRRWRCPRCNVPVGDPNRWQGLDRNAFAAKSIQDLRPLLPRPQSPGATNGSPWGPHRNQLAARLASLEAHDLGHLPIGRRLDALASGEAQRLRIHRAVTSELAGALYLFDEPTAGLHPADVARLLPHLVRLRDAGNTVVAVDHDPALWRLADHVVDLGPGAGDDGGQVVYQGPFAGLSHVAESLTAQWLEPPTPSPPRKRSSGELKLAVGGADVSFPLGVTCVLAGVSGAGKTRLLRDGLYPAVARNDSAAARLSGGELVGDVVLFDQTSAKTGRGAGRSNPATAIKIFDDVRELFAATADARIRNFDAGTFSFNQPGGRCETCQGQGRLAVDMQFLPDVTTTCPECLGRRYRKEVLAITVRGLNVAEVLDLTAREAFRFFRAQRAIEKKLKWLLDVGLDYVRLGQPLDTLSSGEAQRLKLAGHLASARKPRTLFLLVQPTLGLHPADVAGLLERFGQLLAAGHSLIVEDQNPLVLRQADWLVEMEAGCVVAEGTPADVAKGNTPTGRFLRGD